MSNRLEHLLEQWSAQKDELDWVVGIVIETQGSSYRKAGAMMLFNSLGQQFGLLSGGCLESDIMRNARHVMAADKGLVLTYDMQDEDDFSWQLGIGCGGMVRILLQPVHRRNGYLGLDDLHQKLQQRQTCWYLLDLSSHALTSHQFKVLSSETELEDVVGAAMSKLVDQNKQGHKHRAVQVSIEDADWLLTPIIPAPHLLVFGGGVDARPLVAMAAELGWRVTLVDERTAYARAAYFPAATEIIKQSAAELEESDLLQRVNAVVVMNHNLTMDAAALKAVRRSTAGYIGVLGPKDRRDQLMASLSLTDADMPCPVGGPLGLDIGRDLPEVISLSILAECQAVLGGHSARSISNLLAAGDG